MRTEATVERRDEVPTWPEWVRAQNFEEVLYSQQARESAVLRALRRGDPHGVQQRSLMKLLLLPSDRYGREVLVRTAQAVGAVRTSISYRGRQRVAWKLPAAKGAVA